jgi:hypothetical protein
MPFERKVSKVVAVYELQDDGFKGAVPEANDPELTVKGEDLDEVQYALHEKIKKVLGDQVVIVDRVD